MDLDDILDNVMSEPVVAVVAPKPPVVKKPAESAEIKPWLASTANVPPEFRDRWTKLVRQDLSAVAATPFQTSHAYRNWWEASGTPSSNKVLLDLVRKAAAKCNLDDVQTAQLSNSSNPITDRCSSITRSALRRHQVDRIITASSNQDSSFLNFP